MSDDEYEYEYDDDASMGDDGGENEEFEYTDEEEEADDSAVALENLYYNAKALRDENAEEARDGFEGVISKEVSNNEAEDKKYGIWSFKAMKQLVKAALRLGDGERVLKDYQRLLTCIAEGDVSPNQIEKVRSLNERVTELK